jgi:hypothetical protein
MAALSMSSELCILGLSLFSRSHVEAAIINLIGRGLLMLCIFNCVMHQCAFQERFSHAEWRISAFLTGQAAFILRVISDITTTPEPLALQNKLQEVASVLCLLKTMLPQPCVFPSSQPLAAAVLSLQMTTCGRLLTQSRSSVL